MTDKKNSPCGCGCLPEPKKGSKTPKSNSKEPEKPKK